MADAIILNWNRMTRDERWFTQDYNVSADMASAFEKVLAEGRFTVVELPYCFTKNEVFEVMNVRHPDEYFGRSMSVGDIAIEDDIFWVVRPVGWIRLDEISPQASRNLRNTLEAMYSECAAAHGS